MEMNSNIQEFYRNKSVFITGGTGFLGKVFIEKLLRTTDVQDIYMMARPKAGIDITERLNAILKEQIFEDVRSQPRLLKRIKLIAGDCTLPNLGISSEDRQKLIENVNVVVHSAATVRFDERLSEAIQINVQGSIDVMKLAKEMKHLKAYVHVSTAFVNPSVLHSEERICHEHLPITSEKLLSLRDTLGNGRLDEMEKDLLGSFPNTYCFTKTVAEEAVLQHGSILPICIFRPGVILSASEEPQPGWIDNLQVTVNTAYGGAMGVVRVIRAKTHNRAALVPVDYCANIMLATAWYTATHAANPRSSQNPSIYHLVPDESNPLTWGGCWKRTKMYCSPSPFSSMIWHPFMLFIDNRLLYQCLAFIYHTVPAYLMDLLLLLNGKKTRMANIYRKIHRRNRAIHYFMDREFTFGTTNCKKLWEAMTPDDRRLYNFDMASLKWNAYFYRFATGLRRFLAKEGPETIPQAKKLSKRFYVLNVIVHGIVFAGIALLLWTLLICITLT